MPSGGHNKKTDRQLALSGTRRKGRHGTEGERVNFDDGMPHMPPGMNDTAQKTWRRIVTELKNAGQLKKGYEAALFGYAVVYGRLQDDPGSARATDWQQLRGFIAELGLGPVSNTRLRSELGTGKKPSDDSGFDDV